MRPITTQASGIGFGTLIPLDMYQTPFEVSLDCIISGTVTYNIEYTNDDVWNVTPTDWTPVSSMSGLSANAFGTLTSPVRGLHINITAGTGSVTLRVIQAGTLT
jgi:hypothetical protein